MKIDRPSIKRSFNVIPTQLTEKQFDEFFLPHLSKGKRGPSTKIKTFKIFNYILCVLHTGMQWHKLPIDKNDEGVSEIHYSSVFRIFQRWALNGSIEAAFISTVARLAKAGKLDLSILHGDGSVTEAKKGGELLGYTGHKHRTGEKVVAICDRNVNVITPFVRVEANKNETPLFKRALDSLRTVCKKVSLCIKNVVMSLDAGYDSKENRKHIFNAGMTPNIPENKRNRKGVKKGKPRIYSKEIYKERFRTIERCFAWEDKFKRVLIRFERISDLHRGMKLLAYSLINLRHFC